MPNEVSLSVSVPAELSNISNLVQQVVSDAVEGKKWMAIVSAALPMVFAEGVHVDQIKAELKNPKVWVLAGLMIGSIAAKIAADKAAAALAKAAAAPEASATVVP